MPRINKDEINLNVGDDYIDISAKHKESEEEKRKEVHQKRAQRDIHSQKSVPSRKGEIIRGKSQTGQRDAHN